MSRSLIRKAGRAGAAPASSSSANAAAGSPGHRRAFGTFIRRTRHYKTWGTSKGPPYPRTLGAPRGTRGAPRSPGHRRPAARVRLRNGEAGGAGEGLGRLGGHRRRHGARGGAAVEAEGALDGHHELEVQRVARVARDDVPPDAPAEQRQVTQEIEHLVAHELVTVAEPVEGGALAEIGRASCRERV